MDCTKGRLAADRPLSTFGCTRSALMASHVRFWHMPSVFLGASRRALTESIDLWSISLCCRCTCVRKSSTTPWPSSAICHTRFCGKSSAIPSRKDFLSRKQKSYDLTVTADWAAAGAEDLKIVVPLMRGWFGKANTDGFRQTAPPSGVAQSAGSRG